MPGRDSLNFPLLMLHKFICSTDVSEHLKGGREGEASYSSCQTATCTQNPQQLVREVAVHIPALEVLTPQVRGGPGSQILNELLQGIRLQPLISPAFP